MASSYENPNARRSELDALGRSLSQTISRENVKTTNAIKALGKSLTQSRGNEKRDDQKRDKNIADAMKQNGNQYSELQKSMTAIADAVNNQTAVITGNQKKQTKKDREDKNKGIIQRLKDGFKTPIKSMEGIVKAVAKPLNGLKGLLGTLFKGLALATLLTNPEAIGNAIKTLTEGALSLAETLQDENFQKGLGILFEFVVKIAKFGLDRLTQFLDGITQLADGVDSLLKGEFFKWETWEDLGAGLKNTAVGFTALAVLLAPGSAILLGLKGLGLALKAFKGGGGTPPVTPPVTPPPVTPPIGTPPVRGPVGGVPPVSPPNTILGPNGLPRPPSVGGTSPGRAPSIPNPPAAATPGLAAGALTWGAVTGLTTVVGAFQAWSEGFVRDVTGYPFSGSFGGPFMAPIGFNTGAFVPGSGNGDTVLAKLEPGEYVLNKKLVSAIGKNQLDMWNHSMVPRFQTGGIVPLGKKLVNQGYAAWQHPDFNLNSGYTGSGNERTWMRPYSSHHNYGEALDFPLSHNTNAELDALYAHLNKNKDKYNISELLWKTSGHYDHLHVAVKAGTTPETAPAAPSWDWGAALAGAPTAPSTPMPDWGAPSTPSTTPDKQPFNPLDMFSNLGPFAAMAQVFAPITEMIGGAFSSMSAVTGSRPSSGTDDTSGANTAPTGGMSKSEIKALAKSAGFPDRVLNTLGAIAMAESGGNPNIDTNQSGLSAVTGEDSIGLMQVNWKAHKDWLQAAGISRQDLYDPATNMKAAYRIWSDAGGFSPWGAYTNGSYAQHLQKGGNVQPGYGGPKSNISTMPSSHSSGYNAMSRASRDNGYYARHQAPVVVPVPMGGGNSGSESGSTSSTGRAPQLSSSPNSMVSLDYFYRSALSGMLA